MIEAMEDLTTLGGRLARLCPTLDVSTSKRELLLRRDRRRVRLRLGKEASNFDARERRDRRSKGLSYLDLGSGSLYVDEPGFFLFVRLPVTARSRLSPYQCALLSAVLDCPDREWFESGLGGSQVELIELVKLELGIEVSPMAMSRFLDALRTTGILRGAKAARLVGRKGLRAVREDFRLSSVGRAETYAGDYRAIEKQLDKGLDGRFARGVADVLLQETGSWVEPRDYLVDSGALPIARELIGNPVPRGYKGEIVVLRPAQRVPLGLLTLGGRSLQPLLGLSEAARSDSPVARQGGLEALAQLERAWK